MTSNERTKEEIAEILADKAYWGGLAYANFGDYQWMWYADMLLAAFAALINLPIEEASPNPTPTPKAQTP